MADFLPTITIKDKDLNAGDKIAWEHIVNNQSVRKLLLERGIKPENLPAAEDVKKLERRVKSADQRFIQQPDKLKQTED